jgi:cytochrome d ubiquinol oxidase subunit II
MSTVSMLTMHGANFINLKTSGILEKRAKKTVKIAGISCILLFAMGGLALIDHVQGFVLGSTVAHDGPSNPLHKVVVMQQSGWLAHYVQYPMLWLVPGLGFLGALFSILLPSRLKFCGFLASAFSIFGVIASVGVSMFPFILPSSSTPSQSLLVWDSSSSQTTLMIMLVATLIFLPIILTYTAWVYRVLRGEVNMKTLSKQINGVSSVGSSYSGTLWGASLGTEAGAPLDCKITFLNGINNNSITHIFVPVPYE